MKLKDIKKENSKVNKEIESLIEIANIRYILPVASWELKKGLGVSRNIVVVRERVTEKK